MSLKSYQKNLGKINNGFEYARSNRLFWYNFYFDFFIKIATNYFEWVNLPKTIDKLWLEKALNFKGFVGFYYDENFGLIASKGAMGDRLDQYDNATVFKPVNNSVFKFPQNVAINWYDDILDPRCAVIVGNNNYYSPTFDWIAGFCQKLADIEQAIQLNRNAQLRPYVLITDQGSTFSLKNFFNKILNGDPVIYVNAQKDPNGALSAVQLQDRVSVLDTKTEYLLDKLHDEKQRVINQLLTVLGINNNAVDKAERLVAAEATSNNGLINACIQVSLSSRKEGIERVNRCWGPRGMQPLFEKDILVRPSEQIEMFNTEKVIKEIDSNIDDLYEVEDGNI